MPTVGTDAYITSAEYTAYATARGIAITTASLDADIILSADFINTNYNLLDGYAMPSADTAKIAALNKAALKACELQQAGRLTLPDSVFSSGVVSSESFNLQGTYSETITYEAGTQASSRPRTPELDNLIRQSGAVIAGTGLKRG